jgi:hypothetical protein
MLKMMTGTGAVVALPLNDSFRTWRRGRDGVGEGLAGYLKVRRSKGCVCMVGGKGRSDDASRMKEGGRSIDRPTDRDVDRRVTWRHAPYPFCFHTVLGGDGDADREHAALHGPPDVLLPHGGQPQPGACQRVCVREAVGPPTI